MRLRWLGLSVLVGVLAFAPGVGRASVAPTAAVAGERTAVKTGEAYTLPPEVMRKAVAYSRERVALGFVGTAWEVLQLLGILTLGVAYRMRNVAVNVTKKPWGQGAVFLAELMVLTGLLDLPLGMFGHHLAVAYGQSVQGWGSWFGDQMKAALLTFGIGLPLLMLLKWTIRNYPRRWWLVFWVPAMLWVLIGVFISPYVIDPLFNKFEPMTTANPALVTRLEQVVERGGLAIPPERMFVMKASAKVTGLNAYVTGFGASKRVVVWDTSIAKATPDEISFIFGHEMGHYALGHIVTGLAFTAGLLLVTFYLGYAAMNWLLARYGRAWRVPTQQDWGAVIVLLLVVSVLSFLTEPVASGFSRMHEHEADVYGQEAVHGIVADPQGTGQAAFQLLGETSLADPHPSPFVVFWTYSHRDRGGGQLPPMAQDQLALRLGQHRAPADLVGGHAQAQVRQDHLGLDEAHHQQRHAHEDHVAHIGQDVAEHARAGPRRRSPRRRARTRVASA